MSVSHSRSIAPKHRHRRASSKPAEAEVAYPIGDFLIRPTDALGRHVIINVQVAPQVRRAASKMVAKNEFGFETEQDVTRWCLTRGLEELAKKSENTEITGDVAMMVAQNNLAKEELEQQYYLHAIAVQEKAIKTLVATGHANRAAQYAETLWRQYDKIEHPHWRGEFRKRAKLVLDYARGEAIRQSKVEAAPIQRQRARARVS